MVKYDINGNKIWDMIYDSNGIDRFNSVVQTNDGGYAVIMKVDSNGNKIWYKDFKDKPYTNFSSVIQTSGGGICVSGTSSLFSSESRDRRQAIIIMFDNDGNVLWERNNYNNSMINVPVLSMLSFNPIIETNDKSLVILSTFVINEHDEYFKNTIYKIDNTGNVIWRKEFDLNAKIDDLTLKRYYLVRSIIQLNDGSYVVCGGAEGQVWEAVLFYFDSNGNLKQ